MEIGQWLASPTSVAESMLTEANAQLAAGGFSITREDARMLVVHRAFARLMAHVADLYCAGGSSSVSAYEMHELATSVAFVLGIAEATREEAAVALDVDDPVALWREGIRTLQGRTDVALALWRDVVTTMPPIRNVALRDTLASLGGLKRRYESTLPRTWSPATSTTS